MTYSIEILPSARREWRKLDQDIKQQVVRKLQQLQTNPHVPAARLSNMPNCYKIKLRAKGYRVIYQVIDHRMVIVIVAAGKREDGKADIYSTVLRRLTDETGS